MTIVYSSVRVASCIGCGCTDIAACSSGCYWLRVDRVSHTGVCSSCRGHVAAWDRQRSVAAAGDVEEIED